MMWIDVEQNTDDWLMLRLGKVTGSTIGKVMANFGKAFGQPAKNLAINLAVEQITGIRQGDDYSNKHMERGHAEEPIARMRYEEEYFVDVENGGFYDNITTGCSPDGRPLGGLVEIKSAIASVHHGRIKKNTYDPAHKWQLIFNLKESGREWIDFVSYCSSYPNKEKKLFVHRLHKEELKVEYNQIDERLHEFFKFMSTVKAEMDRG